MRYIISFLLGGCLLVFSQQDIHEHKRALDYLDNGGEVYFSFRPGETKSPIGHLTRTLSIDNIENGQVYAYANRAEFNRFLELGIPFEVETHPGDLLENPSMTANTAQLKLDWDKYPTFEAYVAAMHEFEINYPDLVKIVKIGESNQGRDILYAVISDNVGTPEPEPRHMYTSAMHGDETAMYVNFLRLIDHLLTQYSSDAQVKNLVDNVEIWICPLENPDGTYRGDNSTVDGARRSNANNIDLNRHYPHSGVPLSGTTGKEPEAQAVINLIDSLDFVLSANSHGGAELLNYPYDFDNVIHPDEAWMQYVYRQFADAVHALNPSLLTDQNNGLVRGYIWYEIEGSRMDYVTYHEHMREVTFEASSTKLVPGSQYPQLWNDYHQPLLKYIEQNLYGVNGTVVSSVGGTPIRAKVTLVGHDNDQSFNFSKLPHGDFWRPVGEGTYDVEFSADGYNTHVEENVEVNFDEATVLNIQLTPIGVGTNPFLHFAPGEISFSPALSGGVWIRFDTGGKPYRAVVYSSRGEQIKEFSQASTHSPESFRWDGLDDRGHKVPGGYYLFSLQFAGKNYTRGFVYTP